MTRKRAHFSGRAAPWWLMGVLALSLASLRLIHLGADSPHYLARVAWDDGLYVDEGYKTLWARNYTEFGAPRWTPADDYPGWGRRSPITQWSHYLAFKALRPDIETARLVVVAYLALFLVLMGWKLSARLEPRVLIPLILLLGLESTLFFYSRVALFEIPMITLLYGGWLLLLVPLQKRPVALIASWSLLTLLLAFGVKFSAVPYMVPILVGFGVSFAYRTRAYEKRSFWLVVAGAGLAIAAFLAIYSEKWTFRLGLDIAQVARRLVYPQLLRATPFAVLAGWVCAVHGVVLMTDRFLQDGYRAGLVAMVLASIPLLSVIEVVQVRHYVPFLPAYLLLVAEWVQLKGWAVPRPGWARLAGRLAGGVVAACGIGLVLQSSWTIGSFWVSPTWDAERIRQRLVAEVGRDRVVAGNWAAFFALGTPVRALVSNRRSNRVERYDELRPDFFLESDDGPGDSRVSRTDLQRTPWVSLGPLVFEETYNCKRVALYELRYGAAPPAASDLASPP